LPLNELIRLAGQRRNIFGLRDAVVAVACGANFDRFSLTSSNIGGTRGDRGRQLTKHGDGDKTHDRSRK
jgi:hypothetical protein